MAEPAAPPLSRVQVATLSQALDRWAQTHPAPNVPVISFVGSRALTPKQLAEAVRFDEPDGRAFLRMVQFGLESASLAQIIESFGGWGEAGR